MSDKDLWSAIIVSPDNHKLDELYNTVENLSLEEKAALTHKLLKSAGLNVVIGNNNYNLSGSIFFQVNAVDKDSLMKVFELLDKQAIANLLAAISERIAKDP